MATHRKLFFLLLVLLPTQLGLHFWPTWSLVLGRRIDYLSPTLYLTDILIISIILFWVVENVLRGTYYVLWKKRKQVSQTLIRNTKYVIPCILFIFLNIWFASNRSVALYDWFKVLEYILLGWYIVNTRPNRAMVIMGLSIGILYTSGIAVAQFFLQHSVGGLLWWLGERTFTLLTPGIARLSWCMFPVAGCQELLRAYGTFPHPNVLGGYIAVTIPLILNQLTHLPASPAGGQSNKLTKHVDILYGVTLVLSVVTLILTFSRSAWLVGALGAGIAYYVLWFNKSLSHRATILRNTITIILLVVLGGLAIILFPANTDETFVRRAELNTAALTMWERSPFIGVGLGNFLVRLPDTNVSRLGNFLQPVHNIYLLILAETGIVGFLIFLLFLMNSMRGYVLRIMDTKKGGYLDRNMIYVIPLACFLLLGLVDHYSLTLQQGQLLLTLFTAMSLISTSR